MAYDMDLHVQYKMQLANFDCWTAFRAEKGYYQHSVPYNNAASHYVTEGSTVIIRLADNGQDYSSSSRFTIGKHQTDLFESLVEQDGFVQVDSETFMAEYEGNGDDNGGYYPVKYSLPKSEKHIYRRKEGFLIGHIQSKLRKLELSTVRSFTLRKVSKPMLNSMYYKLIINGKYRMSVNKFEVDKFFQVINEQFTTSDGEQYYKKG